jgi:type II secretory pathway component PulJ
MWGRMLAEILARPWARRAAAYALVALTITLFILNIRRTAERTGRAAERLDHLERTNAIQHKMLEAASRRPHNRDDLLERLREGGF